MSSLIEIMSKDPRFKKMELELVHSIVNAPTMVDSFARFRDMKALIPDWKFIFAANSGSTPGLVVNKFFSHGAAIISPFASERVLLLDSATLHEMDILGETKFQLDYSIALDTSAMSCLVSFLGSGSNRLPKDMQEVFSFLAQDHVFTDPMPYVVENLGSIDSDENRFKITRNIEAYQHLKTIDASYYSKHGVIRSKMSAHEIKLEAENFVNDIWTSPKYTELVKTAQYRQKIMLVILLKTVTIQLLHPGWSLQKKMQELLDFMNERLSCMFQRETIIACKYFQMGQKFVFFGKIHKNKPLPEILTELSGMSWDCWHIHHIEQTMNHKPESEARYFFAALLTFDKRYIDLLTCCQLRAFASKGALSTSRSYYSGPMFGLGSESFERELQTRYYSESAVTMRFTNMGRPWLEAQLPSLEFELIAQLATVCKS
ncbi:MAG TPA: hypothetical protein PK702_03195 [Burkholderiaceae bacterium]|jgi:hypothetical protein|nr:hypothetical protein [Burkholderiaceae bacterium]